jgi:hypothetical protein
MNITEVYPASNKHANGKQSLDFLETTTFLRFWSFHKHANGKKSLEYGVELVDLWDNKHQIEQ